MRLGWAEPQEGAWSPPVADHAGAPSARLRHLPPLTMRGRRPAGCAAACGRACLHSACCPNKALLRAFKWEALVDIYLPFLFVHTFWGFHLVHPALFIVYLRST